MLVKVVCPRNILIQKKEELGSSKDDSSKDDAGEVSSDFAQSRQDTEKDESTSVDKRNHAENRNALEKEGEDDEDKEEKPTNDEKVSVIVHDAENEIAQINLEGLLRLRFQRLLHEWHFLSLPSFSFVRDLRGGGEDWIRVEVMARPSSANIILKRLDNIGIGTDMGTISSLQAKLCQTASPWAHKPVKEDNIEEKEAEEDHGYGAMMQEKITTTNETST